MIKVTTFTRSEACGYWEKYFYTLKNSELVDLAKFGSARHILATQPSRINLTLSTLHQAPFPEITYPKLTIETLEQGVN